MLHARKDYNERVQDNANIIPEDEPVFLLRAKDKHALAALGFYIDLIYNDDNVDDVMIRTCEQHLETMENWRLNNIVHTPDMPENTSIYE